MHQDLRREALVQGAREPPHGARGFGGGHEHRRSREARGDVQRDVGPDAAEQRRSGIGNLTL